MNIQLFEHNRKAYDAAVLMLEEEGKAAIVHPTGTGKSFVAFKLAEEHPKEKICWLSPSEYLYNTQVENLKKTLPIEQNAEFKNIRFLSYSKLMKNEESMGELCPDYIILDEFHRCGAEEWGKSVRKLLAMYPDAKILGLSATNVRYLDNQRDMAQELFEGNIASEMTLGEAIARGILAAPKYVISLYSYKKELQKIEKRVAAHSGEKGSEKNEQLLEQLKRALEQAEGLDKVFQKHVCRQNGKYIVFCADKEHMEEMKEHVYEWFHLVDEHPHVYTAYYNNPETAKDFIAFKRNTDEHLKLLFCIDMLNEGVHVEDIDGVILLRPTISPIIYLQQIGRSLSAGNADTPIIFDLVNNFESLYCIDYLKQEIEDAFSLIPCTRGERERFNERFQIIDEVRDCRQLFSQLQQNLSASWETYYLAAQNFYHEKGHLKIPKTYVTDAGLTLGSWIQTQRKVHAGKVPGALTEERKAKLEAIGMIWSIKSSSWEEAYEELLFYYESNGNVDVKARYISESGYPLGKWVSNLRRNVKNKGVAQVLTEEQQKQLEALGMIWDKNGEKWALYIQAAEGYRREHGDLKVPVKYVTESGIALGNWLHAIKHGMSGDKRRLETLTTEQIEQLNALGMEWEKDNIVLWQMKFRLAKDYFEQHGNLDIPVAYCVDGVNLGRWISNIRSKRKNPGSSGMRLDESRIRELDSIGMKWQ